MFWMSSAHVLFHFYCNPQVDIPYLCFSSQQGENVLGSAIPPSSFRLWARIPGLVPASRLKQGWVRYLEPSLSNLVATNSYHTFTRYILWNSFLHSVAWLLFYGMSKSSKSPILLKRSWLMCSIMNHIYGIVLKIFPILKVQRLFSYIFF
jgi:hypothetical protein